MKIVCNYCTSELSSKYLLLRHQKTSKNCLDMQKQIQMKVMVDIQCNVKIEELNNYKLEIKQKDETIIKLNVENNSLINEIKRLQEENKKLELWKESEINKLKEELKTLSELLNKNNSN